MCSPIHFLCFSHLFAPWPRLWILPQSASQIYSLIHSLQNNSFDWIFFHSFLITLAKLKTCLPYQNLNPLHWEKYMDPFENIGTTNKSNAHLFSYLSFSISCSNPSTVLPWTVWLLMMCLRNKFKLISLKENSTIYNDAFINLIQKMFLAVIVSNSIFYGIQLLCVSIFCWCHQIMDIL